MPQLPTAPAAAPIRTSVQPAQNSMRGFVVSNDFSAASQAPQIDVRDAVQQTASVGAIGQGIANVGGVMDHVADIRARALDQKAVLEAEAERAKVTADIGVALADQQAHPEKWESIAAPMIKDARDRLVPDGVSPNAADHLAGQYDVWAAQTMGATRVSSAQMAHAQVVALQDAKIRTAVDNKNWPTAYQGLDDAEHGGFVTPEKAEDTRRFIADAQRTSDTEDLHNDLDAAIDARDPQAAYAALDRYGPALNDDHKVNRLRTHVENGIDYGKKKDDLMQLATTDPDVAMQMLTQVDDKGNFTGHTWLRGDDRREIARFAEGEWAGKSNADASLALDYISKGIIQQPEDLSVFKYLSTQDQAALSLRMAQGAANSPEGYARKWTQIIDYDPATDTNKAQLATMHKEISLYFDKDNAKQLSDELDRRASGTKDAVGLGDAFKTLDQWAFTEKRLGEYQTSKMGPDGNPEVTVEKVHTASPAMGGWWWDRHPTGGVVINDLPDKDVRKPVMIDDPIRREAVAGKVQAIKQQLESEVKAGKITDRTSAFQRMAELAKVDVEASAAAQATGNTASDSLLGQEPAGGKIDPATYLPAAQDVLKKYSR